MGHLRPPLLCRVRPLAAIYAAGGRRRHHPPFLGSQPKSPNWPQPKPKALTGPNPRLRTGRHVAVAQASPVLLSALQRLRPRPGLLRRLHHRVQGENGDVSDGFGGQTAGETGSGEIQRGGDQLRRIRGVPRGEDLAGESG